MSATCEVSYCAECDLRILENFPWCHSCGGPTEPRELVLDQGVAYVSTTTHLADGQRTFVFVDIDDDVRILADAPRPVAIGETGRLRISRVENGVQFFEFEPTGEESESTR